jgi:uncharacterized repeat protein (TIGR01451 family)
LVGVSPAISVSGVGGEVSQTCADPGTDDAGQCTVVISSATPGQTTVLAEFEGTAADSESATFSDSGVKTWVTYRVTVNPPTAENLTGTEHTFTVTVERDSGDGLGFQPVAGGVPAITVTGVGTTLSESCSTGTDDAGECTVVISSATPGQTTVSAEFEGTAADSESATFSDSGVKTWVTYRVTVNPPTAENLTGTNHTFTVTVERDSGAGFAPVVDATPTISVTGVGELVSQTCAVPGTDDAGQCTVVITSATPGQTTVEASFVGTAADSESATFSDSGVKTWSTFRVTVTPDVAQNILGEPHTFTVVVEKTSDGVTWTPVVGAVPNVLVSAPASITVSTCADPGTNAAGACTATVTSPSTATVTFSASYLGVIDQGQATFGDEGTKTWIDYRLTVNPPTAQNLTGTNHTFTVLVEVDLGDGSGFRPLPGATPAVVVSGVGSQVSESCSAGTDADGECTVVITSLVTGTTTVEASFEGEAADSEPVTYEDSGVKTWIDYRVTVNPPEAENLTGTNHTFTVLVEKDSGDGEGFVPLTDAMPEITLTGVGSQVSETCSTGTDGDGECTVVITSAVTGTTTVTADFEGTAADSESATFSDSGVKTWLTYRVTMPPDATNEIGDPHTFTALLEVDDGTGFVPVPGATLAISATGTGSITSISTGVVSTPQSGTCTTSAAGTCDITVNSPEPSALTVTATFAATVAESTQTFDDAATKTWIFPPNADLAIVKNASVVTAERGGTFDWTLDVVNNGPGPALNAVVSDTVPAPFVVTGVTGTAGWSCSNVGNAVTCTKAFVAVGETATFRIPVSTPVDAPAGNVTNVGSVQATTPDPNLANNSDDATVTVPEVVIIPPPPPEVLPPTGSGMVLDIVRTALLLLAAGYVVLRGSGRRTADDAS